MPRSSPSTGKVRPGDGLVEELVPWGGERRRVDVVVEELLQLVRQFDRGAWRAAARTRACSGRGSELACPERGDMVVRQAIELEGDQNTSGVVKVVMAVLAVGEGTSAGRSRWSAGSNAGRRRTSAAGDDIDPLALAASTASSMAVGAAPQLRELAVVVAGEKIAAGGIEASRDPRFTSGRSRGRGSRVSSGPIFGAGAEVGAFRVVLCVADGASGFHGHLNGEVAPAVPGLETAGGPKGQTPASKADFYVRTMAALCPVRARCRPGSTHVRCEAQPG